MRSPVLLTWILATGMLLAAAPALLQGAGGKLQLTVVDAESRRPIPCRLHLKNQAGRPVQLPRLPFFHDHAVIPGQVLLNLSKGVYTFEIERGPEYTNLVGNFIINDFADDAKEVAIRRAVDMAKEGWWSGDLHVHRSPREIEALMLAEDLHIAPVVTWWNDKTAWGRGKPPQEPLVRFDGDRFYHLLAGEDEREGGALLFFNLREPLNIATKNREYPSSIEFLEQARQAGGWIDVEKPFWWDMPLWLSSGMVDSIGLANNHLQREKTLENEAWGKPRDAGRLPSPLGNALWSQEIYYHALNCGFRIPPSAGSGSGVAHNPLGYNRMYVFVGEEFTYQRWWEGLNAGRVIVTNGPLIRPIVAGKLPGHTFKAPAGGEVSVDAVLNLATRDKLNYREVVENGRVKLSVRIDDLVRQGGELPAIVFKESGWFLFRTVAENDRTFRFCSSGPYYVQIGDAPRVSRSSAHFFLDWCNERRERIKLPNPEQRATVMEHHDRAQRFWEELIERATAP